MSSYRVLCPHVDECNITRIPKELCFHAKGHWQDVVRCHDIVCLRTPSGAGLFSCQGTALSLADRILNDKRRLPGKMP